VPYLILKEGEKWQPAKSARRADSQTKSERRRDNSGAAETEQIRQIEAAKEITAPGRGAYCGECFADLAVTVITGILIRKFTGKILPDFDIGVLMAGIRGNPAQPEIQNPFLGQPHSGLY